MTARALDLCCWSEHFSKQATPREGEVKIFAPFCSKLFPRKINKQDLQNKNGIQEGRRHLRLVFPHVARVSDTRGRRVITNTNWYVC